MNLLEIKEVLESVNEINFQLPDGSMVPPHFHVTEVGSVQKHFIDCGGTVRKEEVINFQLFTATDYDHRLSAQKLRAIIELSEKQLELNNSEIEVEYQGETIGKYGLAFVDGVFQLTVTQTDCLAMDKCGIPEEKPRIRISSRPIQGGDCAPGSGCC